MTDAPAQEVLLDLPARSEYLHLVRSVAAATASVDARIPADRVADLRVAVSEAATNAVRARTGAAEVARVVVRYRLEDDRLTVEVRDQGAGFDESALPGLPPAEAPERLLHESGLGVPLMRELADETEIRSGSTGTSVRLVLRITEGHGASDGTGSAHPTPSEP